MMPSTPGRRRRRASSSQAQARGSGAESRETSTEISGQLPGSTGGKRVSWKAEARALLQTSSKRGR